MAQQSESAGAESLVQSTQPFSDSDEYNARLAAALGHNHDRSTQVFDTQDPVYQARLQAATLGNHERSTQAFDSQDPVYKARLQEALGQHPLADPEPEPTPDRLRADAPIHVPAQNELEAAQKHSQPAPQEPQPLGAFLSSADERTRLLFLPSDPESFELKHADVEGHQSPGDEWMDVLWEVEEDESIETLRVLAVSQSVYNVACDITIRRASTAAFLTFRVYFDPSSDNVSLLNTSTSTILVSGSQHDGSDYQEIRVYQSSVAQLRLGTSARSSPSEQPGKKRSISQPRETRVRNEQEGKDHQ